MQRYRIHVIDPTFSEDEPIAVGSAIGLDRDDAAANAREDFAESSSGVQAASCEFVAVKPCRKDIPWTKHPEC